MIESELSDVLSNLRFLTENDANKDFALDWIDAGDTQNLFQIFAPPPPQSHYFDNSYIFDGNGMLLYAFERGDQGANRSPPRPEITEGLLAQVNASPQTRGAVATGFFAFNGKIAAIAATRFRPSEIEDGTFQDHSTVRRTAPILMKVILLNDDVLRHIENSSILNGLTLSSTASNDDTTVPITLLGSNSRAYLSWEQPKTGNMLLRRSIAPIAMICILTVLGHIVVGRITMRLAQAFLRESHEARNDRLTGLLNRAGYEEVIESQRIQKALSLNRLALILLDMDRFKSINDTYGHAAGDLALQAMSERIQSYIRRNDVAARIGGDEFMLVVVDDNPKAAVNMLTARLAEAGRKPVQIDEEIAVKIQASMGVAIAQNGATIRELMMNADRTMYEAKTAGRFLQDAQIGSTPSTLNEQTIIPTSRSA